MKAVKRLGICMDHAHAYIMEYGINPARLSIISSKFTHEEKADSIEKSESLMHHKEQHELSAYYKQIAEIIRHYDEVLLFGVTNAKVELHNILKGDHLFEKVHIKVINTDKMTENQQHAFVANYFSKSYCSV